MRHPSPRTSRRLAVVCCLAWVPGVCGPGRPGAPLPVYGYVLEGVRPLLVLRAPPELPVPANERGYFQR